MKFVYRIVNAVLGALVIVASFFLNLFRIEIITGESLSETIEALSQEKAGAVGLYEEFSIKRFIDFFTGKDDLSGLLSTEGKLFLWPDEFKPLNVRLIIFAAAFALAIAVGIFIIVFSCISDRRLPMLIAGIAGIALVIVMIVSFGSISKSIFTNEVNVLSYLFNYFAGASIISTLIGSAVGSALSLSISLAGIRAGLLIIFICVVAWTAIFYLVELGDPAAQKEKDEKKALKAAEKAK